MNIGVYQSASSLTALERWQDTVAQNLTSAQTNGYRKRTVEFSTETAGKWTLNPRSRFNGPGNQTPAQFTRSTGGINFTGGDTWLPSLKCVKRGGKILVCGATAGYDPKEDLRYVWSFELQIIGSNSFYDENLKALMDMIAAGTMKPVIDEVLPLEKAAQGLKLIEDREVFGKVVITP